MNAALKTETIKRDYIESSILLVASFAQQADRASELRDESVAQRAKAYTERFRQQAMEIIDMLQNPAEAEAYRGRLEVSLWGIESKDSVGPEAECHGSAEVPLI